MFPTGAIYVISDNITPVYAIGKSALSTGEIKGGPLSAIIYKAVCAVIDINSHNIVTVYVIGTSDGTDKVVPGGEINGGPVIAIIYKAVVAKVRVNRSHDIAPVYAKGTSKLRIMGVLKGCPVSAIIDKAFWSWIIGKISHDIVTVYAKGTSITCSPREIMFRPALVYQYNPVLFYR